MQVDRRVWTRFCSATSDSIEVDIVTYPDTTLAAIMRLSRLSWMDANLGDSIDRVMAVLRERELGEENQALCQELIAHYVS